MDCMEDRDETIRIRALELIVGMASKKNINELVRSLLGHIDTTESTCKPVRLVMITGQTCLYPSFQRRGDREDYINVFL